MYSNANEQAGSINTGGKEIPNFQGVGVSQQEGLEEVNPDTSRVRGLYFFSPFLKQPYDKLTVLIPEQVSACYTKQVSKARVNKGESSPVRL